MLSDFMSYFNETIEERAIQAVNDISTRNEEYVKLTKSVIEMEE